MIMNLLNHFKDVCEYLEGAREELPQELAILSSPLVRACWWGLLAGVILLFCGQTSKFIYIDF